MYVEINGVELVLLHTMNIIMYPCSHIAMASCLVCVRGSNLGIVIMIVMVHCIDRCGGNLGIVIMIVTVHGIDPAVVAVMAVM